MITHKHMFKGVMALFVAITLFACEGNYKNIQQLHLADNAPVAEGKNINLKYTDSGKVVTNLLAPKLLDYSNFEFAYQEFPEGVEVRFWNEKGERSTVTSNYAVMYKNSNLVDLRDEVVLITSDSLILEAEQMYWDQEHKWVFTDRPYKMKLKDGSYNNGARFDSNEEFTNFLSRQNDGVQLVDNKKTEDNE